MSDSTHRDGCTSAARSARGGCDCPWPLGTSSNTWETEMCPNCITPWKCNGPHIDMTKGTTSELQTEPNLGVGNGYDTDAVAYVAGLIKERDAARAENADLRAALDELWRILTQGGQTAAVVRREALTELAYHRHGSTP